MTYIVPRPGQSRRLGASTLYDETFLECTICSRSDGCKHRQRFQGIREDLSGSTPPRGRGTKALPGAEDGHGHQVSRAVRDGGLLTDTDGATPASIGTGSTQVGRCLIQCIYDLYFGYYAVGGWPLGSKF